MAFGDSSGPPANGRQLRELLELLEAAGHTGYRDARGPMGFTQRQAGGKFTSIEADDFIELLQTEIHGEGPPVDSRPPTPATSIPKAAAEKPPRPTNTPRPGVARARTTKLGDVPAEELAAELQRRGWVVLEP